MKLLGKLRGLIVRLWYGDVPQHEGWSEGELAPIVVDVDSAKRRHRQCGNVSCSARPMNGSIFCWDCMNEPSVKCVKFPGAELAPRSYGGQYVIALLALEGATTLGFTKLEVLYSIVFDAMLVGTGRHHYA